MKYDPEGDFRKALKKALVRRVGKDEAARIADEAARRYYFDEDVGGPHFELLNVTLRWKKLCGDVLEGGLASGAEGLALVAGTLRWFDGMRYHLLGGTISYMERYQRDSLRFDQIDAATCLAFWKQDAAPRPPGDPLDAFLPEVNAVLAGAGHKVVGRERLRKTMDKLKAVQCLAQCRGWYGLRDKMKFQVAEE